MKFIPFWILLLLMKGLTTAQTNEGMMEQFTLIHNDTDRNYLVYTPTDYDESKSYTLLLALHPASTTGQDMASMTQFTDLANANDVIMAFPSAIAGRWNSRDTSDVDDVGFITSLLDKLIADYAINENNIFVLGYSNGGLMTLKLRCVLSERIRGIISYATPMVFTLADECLSADPVSALVIHGTSDEVFPYSGQATVRNGQLSGTFSADQTIGFLAGLNGCTDRPEGADITGDNASNRTVVTRYPCDNTVNELFTVIGLGHYSWAGTLPIKIDNKDMTLNDAIFRFIKQVQDLS